MRRSSSFTRSLATHLLLVALVALVLLPLGLRMAGIVREQEMADRTHTLRSGLQDIETQLMSINNILMQTSSLRVITRLSLIREKLYPSDYLYMQRCQELLLAIASSNGAVLDIVLTFDENSLIITKHYAFEDLAGFLTHYQLEGIQSEMFASCSVPPEASFLPAARISSPHLQEREAALCYRLPLLLNAYSPLRAVAYVFIRQDYALSALLSNSLRGSGRLQLYDAKDNLLLTYSAPQYMEKNAGDAALLQSDKGLLRVRASQDSRYARQMLSGIYAFIGAILALALVVGVAAASWGAYRQALPIRRLLEELEKQGLSDRMKKDDYAQLKDSLLRAALERRNYAAQVESARQALRAHMLDYLLYGSGLDAAQEKYYRSLLPDLPARYLVGYGSLHDRSDDSPEQSVLFSLLLKRFQALLPEGSAVQPLVVPSFALILPWQERIEGRLLEAAQALELIEPPRLAMALSAPLDNLYQMNMGFEQAKLRFARREDGAWMATEPQAEGAQVSDDAQDLLALQRALAYGNGALVSETLSRLLYRTSLPQADIEQRYYLLRMQLLLFSQQAGRELSLYLPKYQANAHPAQLLRVLDKAAQSLCEAAQRRKRSHNAGLRDQLLDYVHEHFKDPALCVPELAKAHKISEKYCYAFFKEQTSLSPAAYILQLRLQHAAKLLTETDMPIQQVGFQSGFHAFNTFYKAFRREYGMTPSQHRVRV